MEVWTPRDTLEERGRADRQPYRLEVEQGFLQSPKGPSIRFDHVAQALAEYGHDLDAQAVAYDRYAFKARLEPGCHRLGLSLPFVEHPQGSAKQRRLIDGRVQAAQRKSVSPSGSGCSQAVIGRLHWMPDLCCGCSAFVALRPNA